MTAKELRERLAYVTEYEFQQPPQSAREHAISLATAKAHWKQIAYDAIAALEERERVKLPEGPFAALCQWAYDASWDPETITAKSITYRGVTFVPDTEETNT